MNCSMMAVVQVNSCSRPETIHMKSNVRTYRWNEKRQRMCMQCGIGVDETRTCFSNVKGMRMKEKC